LDEDGSGSIGLDELEDPLISLGIAESRDEVNKIVLSVDDDGSG
jgi:Ca2+-binding EF-hand superfamily protein